MAVGKRDIEIIKGDTYTHVIRRRVAGTTTPIAVTGYTFTAQLRKVKTQTTADASFSCAVTDGPNGEVTLTMANTVTTALDVGCYYWDLQQVASGVPVTILRGKAKVVSDTTR